MHSERHLHIAQPHGPSKPLSDFDANMSGIKHIIREDIPPSSSPTTCLAFSTRGYVLHCLQRRRWPLASRQLESSIASEAMSETEMHFHPSGGAGRSAFKFSN